MFTNYAAELLEFEKNGYVFIPNLLNREETDLLFAAAKSDPMLMSNAFDVADTQGGKSRLSGWSHPGDDIYGIVARVPRVVDRMEALPLSVYGELHDRSRSREEGERMPSDSESFAPYGASRTRPVWWTDRR